MNTDDMEQLEQCASISGGIACSPIVRSNYYCTDCDTHWYGVSHCKDCGCYVCGYTESAILWQKKMEVCMECKKAVCAECISEIDGNRLCVECVDNEYRQTAGGRY